MNKHIVYDVESASGRTVLAKGIGADRAAAWMTDHSSLSLGEARLALSVVLPGEHVRCGAISVRVRLIDLLEAMAQLDAAIAAEQASDRVLAGA